MTFLLPGGFRFLLPCLVPFSVLFGQSSQSPQHQGGRVQDLAPIALEVFKGVKQETGVDLQGKIRVRWATSLELAKVLTKDSQELSKAPLNKKILKKLRQQHRVLANQLLGKFDWRENVILISRSSLKQQARVFKMPQLLKPETLKALIAHESIHAVDQIKYSWVAQMKKRGGVSIQQYNAVVEGHAQAVAERVCKAQGWGKGFTVFSSVIGKIPASLSGLERQMVEIRISHTRDAYWKGRSFVLAIEKALGEKGIKRIFEHPPKSFDEVLHPEWYLHPEKRPHSSFDASPAFKAFLEEMPREKWRARKIKASLSQFAAAFSLLPEKERKWILESMLGNNTLLVMNHNYPRAGGMVILTFIQFKTVEDANSYMDSALKLSKIKDRKMATGLMRITESTYEDLRLKKQPVIYLTKTLSVQGKSLLVRNLLVSRKNLVFEILYSNVPIEKSKLLKLGRSLIQKVRFSSKGNSALSPKPASRPGLVK
jgi:hypothetical protein